MRNREGKRGIGDREREGGNRGERSGGEGEREGEREREREVRQVHTEYNCAFCAV